MKSRSAVIIVTISAIVAACLWLVPASGATPTGVVGKCGEGRAGTYKLKSSDATFVKKYLTCVLAADDLSEHASNTQRNCDGHTFSFKQKMAPTIAGFAKAPRSDATLDYINSKLGATLRTVCMANGRWYTILYDTTPPAPTLNAIAKYGVAARKYFRTYEPHATDRAIDVVIQKGVWFHEGTGRSLRFLVLVVAV